MKPGIDALRAMLAGSVDYAGLFPPAGLALEPALENYAAYVREDDSWMLGRFVLPAAKLTEAGALSVGRFDSVHPLRISTLGQKAKSADEFLQNLRTSMRALADFGQGNGLESSEYQFEAPLPPEIASTPTLATLFQHSVEIIETVLPWALQVFWELPIDKASSTLLHSFAEHNAQVPRNDRCRPFALKLRTGGTEAAAFPGSRQLAEALVVARDAGVAVKFTAGLHHPIRHFDETVGTQMHGFLNVFAAGILAREHRLDVTAVQAILEDERPESFRFDADGLTWRDQGVPTAALTAHRKFITSFGSCSFDEPRDDLRRLGLM